MCGNCGYNSTLFWPLTLIFVGVLVMMVNIGVLPAGLWKFWPVVLVVIGLVGLSGSCENCRMGSTPSKKSSKRRR
ncbi:MAG TPA: hypothetical protein DIU47_04410 [Candidatus Pacebacteria bacterium]|nr:MAG: hypothetical protein UX00_C0014G0006 [Microgenomates group bacterium GW2011_GWB1_45_17]KKU23146.1 MAG: hypothetical protein UX35_C0010G0064 [Microgenomates group bacterium GW2011_GWA1_46_15]KKU23809.1 MAG: hypothetical protein UX36_C0003G0109 [Microgenomates group bacterium GW2011_GWC1_46_15]HCR93164.1 hypothetical protein [Candidatus Paceibacterota bacterium]